MSLINNVGSGLKQWGLSNYNLDKKHELTNGFSLESFKSRAISLIDIPSIALKTVTLGAIVGGTGVVVAVANAVLFPYYAIKTIGYSVGYLGAWAIKSDKAALLKSEAVSLFEKTIIAAVAAPGIAVGTPLAVGIVGVLGTGFTALDVVGVALPKVGRWGRVGLKKLPAFIMKFPKRMQKFQENILLRVTGRKKWF